MNDLKERCEAVAKRVDALGTQLVWLIPATEPSRSYYTTLPKAVSALFDLWERACNCSLDDTRTELLLLSAEQATTNRALLMTVALAAGVPTYGRGHDPITTLECLDDLMLGGTTDAVRLSELLDYRADLPLAVEYSQLFDREVKAFETCEALRAVLDSRQSVTA